MTVIQVPLSLCLHNNCQANKIQIAASFYFLTNCLEIFQVGNIIQQLYTVSKVGSKQETILRIGDTSPLIHNLGTM
jgi:hypothetical protein